MKKLLIVIIAILFLGASPSQGAAATRINPKVLEFIEEKLDFALGTYYEYDDNILFEETNEPWSLKTVLTPYVSYQQAWEDLYLSGSYNAEVSYFQNYNRWLFSHRANGQCTIDITDRWTIGVRNNFTETQQQRVWRGNANEILRLGFDINNLYGQTTYMLTDRITLAMDSGFDYIDFSDANEDIFIDRNLCYGSASFSYRLLQRTYAIVRGVWRHLGFKHDQAVVKNFNSYQAVFELAHSFPRLFNVNGSIGYEWRDFYKTRDRSGNPVVGANITSSFSRYTSFNVYYQMGLADSSRSEYRQYVRNIIGASFMHYVTPRSILNISGYYENLFFNSADKLNDSYLPPGTRKTELYSASVSFRQILTSWLSAECGYYYLKRDTDFEKEGYTDNRISAGLRAYW